MFLDNLEQLCMLEWNKMLYCIYCQGITTTFKIREYCNVKILICKIITLSDYYY